MARMVHPAAGAADFSPLTLVTPVWRRGDGRIVDQLPVPDHEELVHPLYRINDHDLRSLVACELLTRGCHRHSEPSIETKARLNPDGQQEGTRHNLQYLGINGRNFSVVLADGCHHQQKRSPSRRDDYDGVQANDEPNRSIASTILPPMKMLVPGQIGFVKHMSRGNGYAGGLRPSREVSAQEMHNYHADLFVAVVDGFPPPILSGEYPEPADMHTLADLKDGKYFHMYMPILSEIDVPRRLVELSAEFAKRYPHDPLTVNLMLTSMIVWAELQVDGHKVERKNFYKEDDEVAKNGSEISNVSLAVFLIYFPHVLRLHEYFGLACYAHPYRIVDSLYKKDHRRCPNEFAVNPAVLPESEILATIRQLNLNDHQFREVIPASMPGSNIPIPLHMGSHATRTVGTQNSLMMDDIHSIGLPTYGWAEAARTKRTVLFHQDFIPPGVLVDDASFVPELLSQSALSDQRPSNEVKLFSAPNKSIIPRMEPFGNYNFGDFSRANVFSHQVGRSPFERLFQPEEASRWWQEQTTRKELAARLHIPLDRIYVGSDLLDTWDGISDHLRVRGPVPARMDLKVLRDERRRHAEENPGSQPRPVSPELREELSNLVNRYMALGRPVALSMAPLRQAAGQELDLTLVGLEHLLETALTGPDEACVALGQIVADQGIGPDGTLRNRILEPVAIIIGVPLDGSNAELEDAIGAKSRELRDLLASIRLAVQMPPHIAGVSIAHYAKTILENDFIIYVQKLNNFRQAVQQEIENEE